MKKRTGIIVLVIVALVLGLLGWYAETIISGTAADSDNSLKLGLDLSGGVSVTYQIVDEDFTSTDVDDTKAKLEERAESYSTESSVYQVGDDRITVEIPGVYNAEAVLEDLGSPGSLYFISETDSEGNSNYTRDTSVEGGYTLNYDIETLIENGSVIMTGDNVKTAKAQTTTSSDTLKTKEYVVVLTLDDEGTAAFATATTAAYAAGETIGIYYDDHFISVPSVSEAITGGECRITGSDTYEEAEELATFIRIGAIKLELEELESNVVGASLGDDALYYAAIAAGIGLVLVMIFMIVMYGISGVAADIALLIYSTLVLAIINLFEITLTLPGIAGVILGIGMAVDANVIIFARIREEIAAGKTVKAAIEEGYKKALSAILDGNITTFIAAIVLMILGSGTVKGFAYTFTVSILVSMFTALVVAKYVMKAIYALGCKDEKFYGRAKDRKPINFIKHKLVYFIISLAIIVAGFAGMGIYGASTGNALNYGIEFAGGTSTTITMTEEYDLDRVNDEIIPVVQDALGDITIQATTVDGTNQVVLKTKTLSLDEREALNAALTENFTIATDEDGNTEIESQTISSTISGEMRQKAIWAVVVACIFMLLYIWFRFKDLRFASSAILALVHDVLIVLTAYALIRISVGNTFIACMLTIVGYSINDTIVIFDRIRENMHGIDVKSKEDLAEIANKSLTQTLSRSINTSITTFIMVFLLYIVGVTAIKEFALPLMVGLIAGSYSSIFIATEIWYVLKCHVGKNRICKK